MHDLERTLKTNHLAQLQGSPSHPAQLRHKSVHIGLAKDEATFTVTATCRASEALTHGTEGHAGSQATVLP